MAKYYTETHSHPFSWQQVAEAIFQRYPNPFSTHVLSEDTVYRSVVGGSLYTRRFLTKTNKLPSWGEKYLARFKKMVPLVEESIVDREKKVITTYTRNVGLSMFMSAIEKVSYHQHPHDPNVTIAVKEAWFESGLYGLRSAVKNFGVERFKQNCQRATDGFNHVLVRLHSQQQHLSEIRARKWQEVKDTGAAIRVTAKHAAEVAKCHSQVHAASEASAGVTVGRTDHRE